MRSIGEKCAVFGVYGNGLDAARITFFGLYALQHRGQESSGIAASDGSVLHSHREMGLVSHAYSEENIRSLHGTAAIGHNRYSTAGGSKLEHAQPLMVNEETIALAHNGNIPGTRRLEELLTSNGVEIDGLSDSALMAEAIGYLSRNGRPVEAAIEEVYHLMDGAFSVLVLTKDKLIAFRDRFGIRPLAIGKLNGGYVFSSETCAFHPVGATFLRDVRPGEMVVASKSGLKSTQVAEGDQKLDVFEYVYFSRPDSVLLGQSVYDVRRKCGIELAKEFPVEADVVIPVPETAIPAAIGYAAQSGIPFEMGLVKNRYIHRTFIEPEPHMRKQGVKSKLTPLREVIEGKRVVVIDDSIVRGTTSQQIVSMLFDTGAKAVHFMVSSPPVKYPDFYGIDLPNQKTLLAAEMNHQEMLEYLNASSLSFLSYDGMIRAIGIPEADLCTSCFNGEYPIDIGDKRKDIRFGI
ncbi:amidophosphoribosyltransferase [Faunimonas pinastri]|uniref:Amidophosphoribosyltransferase n=1 Tax=Faunimonas pinastri TaxID=1855383 RepID=A0A1H9N9A4_9HYPH|nr:amidophosphoribosyltransferase [Faunimonas pinastri]SER32630.1 amidophosphoribosyltransferase [Faunimonas pinastri]